MISDAKSAKEYVPSVPDDLAGIFEVTGQGCMTDSDCDDLWPIPDGFQSGDYVPSWICENDTIANTNSTDPGVCLFIGCDESSDCESNELCRSINICDPETDEFYDNDNNIDYLHSSMCLDAQICTDDGLRTPGNWTDDTMVCNIVIFAFCCMRNIAEDITNK